MITAGESIANHSLLFVIEICTDAESNNFFYNFSLLHHFENPMPESSHNRMPL